MDWIAMSEKNMVRMAIITRPLSHIMFSNSPPVPADVFFILN